jgi:hypothetical protein
VNGAKPRLIEGLSAFVFLSKLNNSVLECSMTRPKSVNRSVMNLYEEQRVLCVTTLMSLTQVATKGKDLRARRE